MFMRQNWANNQIFLTHQTPVKNAKNLCLSDLILKYEHLNLIKV